jgi:hypothetical protein
MGHYKNDNPIIFDQFNELISLSFEMEINPVTKILVTADYIAQCIYLEENYTFSEYIVSSRSKNQRKPRSNERGGNHQDNAQSHYLLGVTTTVSSNTH